jgi:Ca2+-binding RTX toxin-like protein
VGGSGDDIIDGGGDGDYIDGGDGNDIIIYDKADFDVTGGAGIDTLDASKESSDLYFSLSESSTFENLVGGSGNDVLYGNSKDNVLIGGNGNDVLNGQAGNDILYGGNGDDLYLYSLDGGNDIIKNYEDSGDNGEDTVQFQDLTLTSIAFTRDSKDLLCTIIQTGETIRIADWGLGEKYYVDKFLFTDGMLTAADVNLKII